MSKSESKTTTDLEKKQAEHCAKYGQPWLGPQTTYSDEIEERFKFLVHNHLGCELRKVTDGANFIHTLGADSLDAIELIMATEKEFGIEISDDEAEKIEIVDDAIKLIRRKSK